MTLSLDERRIAEIVQRVVADLRPATGQVDGQTPASLASRPSVPPRSTATTPVAGQAGVYPDIDGAIIAAAAAQKRLTDLPLERRSALIASMRQSATENAPVLARAAHQETSMGRYEDKLAKNLLVAERTPGTEALQAQAWTGDRGLTLVELAPYGVIGAITPSTNPTSTIICNAIGIIAAGNAVVFNAHPGAKACSAQTVQILNQAIQHAGGPPDLITCPVEPTIESAQYLMRHPTIRLLVVTGGPGVVKEAMKSGKKAICAGPGNPPVVVDETADLEQAGRDIVKGASFDNNVVCILEKEIIAVESIADQLKAVMRQRGAVEIDSWQLNRLMKAILAEDLGPGKHSVVNKAFVGKAPSVILREIGVNVDESVRLVLAETDAQHHPAGTSP
jgi:acyl-CoA reductase-like NAD-dependent aldehyde dehydrogenase